MQNIKSINVRNGIIVMLLSAILGIGCFAIPTITLAGQSIKDKLPIVDGETQLFPGYPLHFDGVGHIDRIGKKEIVISDDLLFLPSQADLRTPRSRSANVRSFQEGDYVGYQLDGSGAIKSLWLLHKGQP